MNEFYKLLIFFQKNEKITRFFLLSKPLITPELISEALQQGYIAETTPAESGEVRYVITPKGINKRDQ